MSERRALPVLPKSSLRTDGKREKIVPADVRGRFDTLRHITFVVLMVLYLALPWINVGGRPLVLFHVAQRQAFLFGLVFNAQDMWMMVFVLTGAAFALVVVTAVLGRVWCGWGCPQTVWIEGLYRRLERWIEGPREKRMRRDAAGPSWAKTWRKVLLHTLWAVISLALAHAFLAYFMPVRDLIAYMQQSPAKNLGTFVFAVGLAGILYFDFAWFREQFCVVMCPYGRMQSALLDDDSLVVGYDVARGEPRGKKGKEGAGDCVDCNRCVVVCPTGIDIRNGLQMDCIACTACIDACDDIMDKLERPRGLIRYDSQAGLAGRPRQFWRSRLTLYAALGVVGLAASTFAFTRQRTSFEANLMRAAGLPFQVEDGIVRNGLHVHLVNKYPEPITFTLTSTPAANVQFLIPLAEVKLAPLADANVPFFVSVPKTAFKPGEEVEVVVTAVERSETRALKVKLLGPAR